MNEVDLILLAGRVAKGALKELAGNNNRFESADLRKSAIALQTELERQVRVDHARCVYCWEYAETDRCGACDACAEIRAREAAADAQREEEKGAYAS